MAIGSKQYDAGLKAGRLYEPGPFQTIPYSAKDGPPVMKEAEPRTVSSAIEAAESLGKRLDNLAKNLEATLQLLDGSLMHGGSKEAATAVAPRSPALMDRLHDGLGDCHGLASCLDELQERIRGRL